MGFYMLDNPNPNATQGVFPRRGGVKLSGTAILHTSESVLDQIGPDATAEDCAAFIRTRTDFGCYHDLVDSDSIIEMYPFEWETWQDTETNNWAVGIAAACRTTDWATMDPARREGFYKNLAWCAADFVKYMKSKGINVPLKRITGPEARAGIPGFCAHGDSGIHRSDPGKDFDWTKFFAYTKQILNGTLVKEEEMPLTDADVKKIWGLKGSKTGKTIWSDVVDTYNIVMRQDATIAGLTKALSVASNLTEEQITEAVREAFAGYRLDLVKDPE